MGKKLPFYRMKGHTLPGPNQKSPIEFDAEDLPDITIGGGGGGSGMWSNIMNTGILDNLLHRRRKKRIKYEKEQSWSVGQSPN